MKQLLVLLAVMSMAALAVAEDDDRAAVINRLQAATDTLDEVMSAPDGGIPREVIHSAECVAIVPSMLKGAFVVGGNYGKGVATCRTANGWSTPAFFRVTGMSLGFQIGGQAVDLVMLFMNEQGMKALLSSKFKLGADVSVAAGPVGRHVEGGSDYKFKTPVLTYSRARGVFAGISLSGASVRQDRDDTRLFYGRNLPFNTLLTGKEAAPVEANTFLAAVEKYATPPPAQPAPEQKPAAEATKPTEPEAKTEPPPSQQPNPAQPQQPQAQAPSPQVPSKPD